VQSSPLEKLDSTIFLSIVAKFFHRSMPPQPVMHDSKSLDDPVDKPAVGSSNETLEVQEKDKPHTFNEQTNYVPTKVIITVSSP
jgi:hypothetical protein